MHSEVLDAKSRIIKAAMELLEEEKDINKITIRRIAERANVGVGLINYHFKTKETLLNESVNVTMSDLATKWLEQQNDRQEDPATRLKSMLVELCDFGIRHEKFMQISVPYELLYGDMQTPLYIIPILREIFSERKDEVQLRILALQLITTIQVIFLRSSTFRLYAGIDLNEKSQRNRLIETLVDSIIK